MIKRNLPDELMFLRNRKLAQHETNVSLKDKVCVISGATSGVGLEATKQLVQAEAHVVIIARNPDKAHQLKQDMYRQFGQWIDIIIADFSSLDDVRAAANTLLNNYSTIDILINCAGIHSTKKTYTSEGFETVFCVNHLAPFLLTNLLLRRMIASAPSRILHVNSEGHRFNGLNINDLQWKKRIYTGLRGYGASKTAQLLTMWEINDQLKGTGVTINAMHPGDVKTNIGSNNGWLYRLFSKHVTQRLLQDPSISGKSIYYLVADPNLASVSGQFFHLTINEKPAKHALNRTIGKRVYDISKQLTGLSD